MEQPPVKTTGCGLHGEEPPRPERREAQSADKAGRFDDESL